MFEPVSEPRPVGLSHRSNPARKVRNSSFPVTTSIGQRLTEQEKKRLTTKDTKKSHLVALSFVLFVSFVVHFLQLREPALRNLWFFYSSFFFVSS